MPIFHKLNSICSYLNNIQEYWDTSILPSEIPILALIDENQKNRPFCFYDYVS